MTQAIRAIVITLFQDSTLQNVDDSDFMDRAMYPTKHMKWSNYGMIHTKYICAEFFQDIQSHEDYDVEHDEREEHDQREQQNTQTQAKQMYQPSQAEQRPANPRHSRRSQTREEEEQQHTHELWNKHLESKDRSAWSVAVDEELGDESLNVSLHSAVEVRWKETSPSGTGHSQDEAHESGTPTMHQTDSDVVIEGEEKMEVGQALGEFNAPPTIWASPPPEDTTMKSPLELDLSPCLSPMKVQSTHQSIQ